MLDSQWIPGWWLNQPLWKILVKLEVFPNFRGENKKCLKPPTSLLWVLRARFPMNSVFSHKAQATAKWSWLLLWVKGSAAGRPGHPEHQRCARDVDFHLATSPDPTWKKKFRLEVVTWNLKIHGWSTYPPRVTYTPHHLMMRAYENHWFPLIRLAIKPLFLRGVG